MTPGNAMFASNVMSLSAAVLPLAMGLQATPLKCWIVPPPPTANRSVGPPVMPNRSAVVLLVRALHEPEAPTGDVEWMIVPPVPTSQISVTRPVLSVAPPPACNDAAVPVFTELQVTLFQRSPVPAWPAAKKFVSAKPPVMNSESVAGLVCDANVTPSVACRMTPCSPTMNTCWPPDPPTWPTANSVVKTGLDKKLHVVPVSAEYRMVPLSPTAYTAPDPVASTPYRLMAPMGRLVSNELQVEPS